MCFAREPRREAQEKRHEDDTWRQFEETRKVTPISEPRDNPEPDPAEVERSLEKLHSVLPG